MTSLIKNRLCVIILSFLITLSQQSTLLALSIKQEENKGEEFLAEVKRYLVIVDDPFLNDFIYDFGQYLVKAVETRHFKYNFYIIKNEELNAFAAPAGHIFIHTGLIRAMDEVEELAAVMCHEIAHVSSRHISRQFDQAKKLGYGTLLGMLAGILVGGGDASEAVMAGTIAASQQKMLSYSREAEREADQLGFTYAAKSGFNPAAIKSALATLQAGHFGSNKIPAYLLTHPIGPERISNIESMLASPFIIQEREKTIQFKKQYPVFRTIVMAKYEKKDEMINMFSSELSKNPDSPMANLGMGIVLKDNSEYKKSIEHLEKAVDGLADPLPVWRYLSEAYLFNNEPEKAISALQKALENNGNDKPSLFTLAKTYLKIEEYGKAIDIYEKLKLMEPVEDIVFYDLGYSYGKENKLGLAHYNFGLFYERLKNMKEARFHFNEAKKKAADNPQLFKKIDESMIKIDEDEDKDKKESIDEPDMPRMILYPRN
ncbi:MAG: M48 family metalloprotease [Deltaproteobacteria bacterium]|nr:M48 family metalloprotease [Deltaproteobacteria bacterium]